MNPLSRADNAPFVSTDSDGQEARKAGCNIALEELTVVRVGLTVRCLFASGWFHAKDKAEVSVQP